MPFTKKTIHTLSIAFFAILSFFVFAQTIFQEKTEVQKVALIKNNFEKIMNDSSMRFQRIDTLRGLINHVQNDSLKQYYGMVWLYYIGFYEQIRGNCLTSESYFTEYVNKIDPKIQHEDVLSYHADAYRWLGNIKKIKGEYGNAIEAYQSSIPFDGNQGWTTANTIKLIGDIYMVQNQLDKAKSNYLQSLDIYKNTKPKSEEIKRNILERRIRAYEALAECSRLEGNTDEAIKYLDKRRPLLGKNTETNLMDSYRLEGLILSEKGLYKEANIYYAKALRLTDKYKDAQKTSEIFRLRGEIYLKQQKYEAAISDFDSALVILSNKGKVILKHDYAMAMAQKTEAMLVLYKKQNNKNVAELSNIYTLLDKNALLFDSIATDFGNNRDKQSLYALRRHAFENGIWTAQQLYENSKDSKYIEKAFLWSEQSRSAALRSIAQLANVRTFAGVPDSIAQKDDALRQKIASFETALRLSKIEASNGIALEIQKVRLQQKQLLVQIENKYPDYYKFKYQSFLSATQIIENLAKNSSVIEYFVGKEMTYGFVLSSKGITLQTIPCDEDSIKHTVNQILPFVKGTEENRTAYQNSAYQLYKLLLAPIENQLAEQVIIISDGELAKLPFEVLLTEKGNTTQGVGTLLYWLKKRKTSYHYAANLLFNTNNKNNKGKDFALFSPSFTDDPYFQGQSQVDFVKNNIKSAKIYEKQEASKENFIAHATDYQVLHINTHGVANDEEGDLSYLRFTNDKLYTSDLYSMKLNANLVVLSACQTAEGEVRKGEGAVGLTLGFLYAGAKSVISSLWSVNQSSTNEFVQVFYQQLLQKNVNNNQALHQAKLDLVEKNPTFAHPKYWAAFVLVGNPDMVVFTSNFSFWWFLPIAFLPLLAIGIRKIKNRN